MLCKGEEIMDFKKIIVGELLDKYEKSKSVYAQSNRRILLKLKDWNTYDIENYETKKAFHDSVEELAKQQIIEYSWQPYEKR